MNTHEDLQRRIRSLHELPQDIAPARDLWPQIAAQLQPRRRSWAIPASLAAGVLVAAAFVTGYHLHDSAPMPVAQTDSGALIQVGLGSDPDYQRERAALLRTLPAKLAQLPPDSQQHVRDGLQAIQTAMQQIEAELGSDASNALLQELLIQTRQEEMRVLTTVEEIDDLDQEI